MLSLDRPGRQGLLKLCVSEKEDGLIMTIENPYFYEVISYLYVTVK